MSGQGYTSMVIPIKYRAFTTGPTICTCMNLLGNWRNIFKWSHHVAAGKTGDKNPKHEQNEQKKFNKHQHSATRIESRNSNTQKSQ